ncbi:protein SAR DEFICIENT 1-like [Primulina huaijiensis]|uniref:protein SAR DEFICIENT 1-like n=1 Tax=Primulina huaijiensis TaxID=1492673 RepID=UPI003CC78490
MASEKDNEALENFLRTQILNCIPKYPLDLALDRNGEYEVPTDFKLRFNQRLSLPIFTGNKIVDIHNNPLQIILDSHDHHQYPPYSIGVEILVLDGDFPGSSHNDTWSKDEFARYIKKERTEKRPLITGESKVTLWNGVGVVGDIKFTDNSSWIRSRRFRLGARVVQIQGGNSLQNMMLRIREAVTEPFVVKEHRIELYKKHHPPTLEDEVWRLDKIGKRGVFYQKLASEGIHTVQDFLKLFMVDSSKLREIMGAMSDRMWEATLKHAKTCVMGTKLYRFHGDNYILTLNPICQLVKIEINGQIYLECDFERIQGAHIQRFVKDAYANWNCVEEVDSEAQNTVQLITNKVSSNEEGGGNARNGL